VSVAASEIAGLFIDGSWHIPADGGTDEVLNPATEEVLARSPLGGDREVDLALAAARRAFDSGPWPRMTNGERATILTRFGDELEKRTEELVALVVAETGATQAVARAAHVDTGLRLFRTAVELTAKRDRYLPLPPMLTRARDGRTTLGTGVRVREAAGVVSAITPFNFPLFLNLVKLGPALAAGCTVVLKPSPHTPLEALVLGQVAEAVDLPPGVLNIITGGLEVGQRLCTDPRVDLITFTGSDAVGASVMAQAAPGIKRVLLELGGKSAMIVRGDADPVVAAQAGVGQIIVQAGQACALHTRQLVHRSLVDSYLEAATKAVSHIQVGDPADPSVSMGPLIRAAQRDRVERYVSEGVDAGAEVVFGGKRPAGLDRGFFFEPTLLVGDNEMTVAREEIFGPVGVVIPFDTDDEAVALANDSDFGLSGAIWSADAGAAFEMALRMRTGNVSLNGGSGNLNTMAPFGGFKRSGIGREFGEEGLDEYTEVKVIGFQAR
jgi:aldehyde dehydrogenase (NAD+)